MKKTLSILLAVLCLASALAFSGCGKKNNSVFIPDDGLRAEAEAVIDSLGYDRRTEEYLKIRPSIEKFDITSKKSDIESQLEKIKKVYSGIDSSLSFKSGANVVNEQLFEYLVVGTYYYKAEFNEYLLEDSSTLKDIIVDSGYKLIFEFLNNGGRTGNKYYYGNGNVHDEYNYYSVCTLFSGKVEYVSLPVFYEPITEQFIESYAAKSADERAVVFDESVKYFAQNADVANDPVLKLIYSEDELAVLQSYLDSLDVEYLDKHNIASEQEPYSNRQIPVQLGNTRFILRVTIYGVYMDVIQNKDYYNGSFFKGLDTLRRAYLGTEPTVVDDDMYIVIG